MHSTSVRKASTKLIKGLCVPLTGNCTTCGIRPMMLMNQLAVCVENRIPGALVRSSLHPEDRAEFLVLGNMLHILFTVLHPLMRE